MDTTQPENIFSDVPSVVQSLPTPIRTFLTDGSAESTVQTITQKNHLHANQSTIIERDLLLTLMGIQEPSSLPQTLSKDAGLDEKTLQNVLRDMDTLVFVPLHKAMQSSGLIPKVEISTEKDILVEPVVPTPPPQNLSAQQESPVEINHVLPTQPDIARQHINEVNDSVQIASAMNVFTKEISAQKLEHRPEVPLPASTTEHTEVPLTTPVSKDNKPIVKEYAIDPYRESIE